MKILLIAFFTTLSLFFIFGAGIAVGAKEDKWVTFIYLILALGMIALDAGTVLFI